MSELDACLLARFPGTRPPGWLRRWLDDGLGGVLLLGRPGNGGACGRDGPPGRGSPGEPSS